MSDRLSLLAARVAEAQRHAPALAARLAGAGLAAADLARPGALDRLPVLSKHALIALQEAEPPFAGFLGVDPREIGWVHVSTGPICEPVLAEDATGMGMDRMFAAAGIGPGDLALNTWSYHLVPAGLLFERGLRACGAAVIPAGTGNSELQADLIARLRPTAFLGSAPHFATVAGHYRARHGATAGHWSLRHAFLAGEPGDWPEQRLRIEAEHGVAVHSAYGTADLGLVGYETRGLPGYDIHPERLVQVCDPGNGAPLAPGEPGQIVVTTLARGWPMIRFGTGDLGVALERDALGFARRIGPILGRVGAGVKLRELFVYPDHLARLAAEIGAPVQLLAQRELGRDVLTLVTEAGLPDAPLIEAFRRLTRLGADRIRRAAPEGAPILDLRHSPAPPLQTDRSR